METRDGVADVMEYYNGGNNNCNDFLQDWQFWPAGNNIDNTTGNNVNYSNSNSTGNGNSNGYSNIANNQAQQVAAQAEKPAVRIKVNGKKFQSSPNSNTIVRTNGPLRLCLVRTNVELWMQWRSWEPVELQQTTLCAGD